MEWLWELMLCFPLVQAHFECEWNKKKFATAQRKAHEGQELIERDWTESLKSFGSKG